MAVSVRMTTGSVVNQEVFWPQGWLIATSSAGQIILDAGAADDALLTPPIHQYNVHRM